MFDSRKIASCLLRSHIDRAKTWQFARFVLNSLLMHAICSGHVYTLLVHCVVADTSEMVPI